MKDDEFVYTASGELVEFTFGTYEEAFEELTRFDAWGVILKHLPYSFEDETIPEETIVYEHRPDLKK